MAYQAQAVDTTEPVSDTGWEISANSATYNVVSGCALAYDAANLTVDVAAGIITHNGSIVVVAAATNAVTLVADGTNPRFTWIHLTSAGVLGITSGTAASDPAVPELGDNVAVALVRIDAAENVANDVTKIDKRIPAPQAGLDALQVDLRDNRALISFVDGPGKDAPADGDSFGLGMRVRVDGSGALAAVPLRGGAFDLRAGGTGDSQAVVSTDDLAVYGDRNPHYTAILTTRAAIAALKVQFFGFAAFTDLSSATSTSQHKAGFRSVTTGALFAVSGNGSNEETTSLSGSHTLGNAGVFDALSTNDGAAWKFYIANVLVATHSTQVPTVTTGMYVVTGIENNTTTDLRITNIDLIMATADRS